MDILDGVNPTKVPAGIWAEDGARNNDGDRDSDFFSGGKNSRVLGEAILCAIAEMVKAT